MLVDFMKDTLDFLKSVNMAIEGKGKRSNNILLLSLAILANLSVDCRSLFHF